MIYYKHKRFIDELLAGCPSAREAYRKVYGNAVKDESVDASIQRIMGNEEVKAYYEQGKKERAQAVKKKIEWNAELSAQLRMKVIKKAFKNSKKIDEQNEAHEGDPDWRHVNSMSANVAKPILDALNALDELFGLTKQDTADDEALKIGDMFVDALEDDVDPDKYTAPPIQAMSDDGSKGD